MVLTTSTLLGNSQHHPSLEFTFLHWNPVPTKCKLPCPDPQLWPPPPHHPSIYQCTLNSMNLTILGILYKYLDCGSAYPILHLLKLQNSTPPNLLCVNFKINFRNLNAELLIVATSKDMVSNKFNLSFYGQTTNTHSLLFMELPQKVFTCS